MWSVIGAGISAISSLFGNKQSGDNVQAQINAQREENAKNREFNASEAEKSRNYQTALIESYRRYNSPANQMRLYEDAGLNPFLMTGQLGNTDSIQGGTPASASSHSGISPVSYSPLSMAETANIVANTQLTKAKAREADTNANLKEQQALTESLMRDGNLKLQAVSIDVGESTRLLNESHAAELSSMALNLNQQIEESKARIKEYEANTRNINIDTMTKRLNYMFESKTFNDRVEALAASKHITVVQAKYALAQTMSHLAATDAMGQNYLAQAFASSSLGKYYKAMESNTEFITKNILPSQWNHIKWTNQSLAFNLGQAQKWDDVTHYVSLGSDILHTGIDLFGAVMTRGGSTFFHNSNSYNRSETRSNNYNHSVIEHY